LPEKEQKKVRLILMRSFFFQNDFVERIIAI